MPRRMGSVPNPSVIYTPIFTPPDQPLFFRRFGGILPTRNRARQVVHQRLTPQERRFAEVVPVWDHRALPPEEIFGGDLREIVGRELKISRLSHPLDSSYVKARLHGSGIEARLR